MITNIKPTKKYLFVIAYSLLLVLASCLPGCSTAKDFQAHTLASYESNGVKVLYDSTKNQEAFKANIGLDVVTGKINNLNIETTAMTPEASIAAALQQNAKSLELIQQLIPLLLKSAPIP